MNPDLDKLQPYPFEKMATLLQGITPSAKHHVIKLGIGEPKHLPPQFVLDELIKHADKVQNYPTTGGLTELSKTIADWLKNRFSTESITTDNIVPVMGTREAIFSFVQASIDHKQATPPIVVMPNPFYQIYEGATILANAETFFVPCLLENGFNPDYRQVPDTIWERTQLVFACSPNNPTGAVLSMEDWQYLLEKSDEFGFIVASDECYSELYRETPPVGLLEACQRLGRDDYHQCVVFHSLSKRSNLPGLRSGFIAGDSKLLKPYMKYRTYQGCAMPLHHQYASIKAWQDETHVEENREQYRQKFDLWQREFAGILELNIPQAGFYLWVKVPDKFNNDDEKFVITLLEELNILALAGSYLSREVDGKNPAKGYIRLALVASVAENQEAITRIKTLL